MNAVKAIEPSKVSLPKPPRVEKWQRWLDSRGIEFVTIERCRNSPYGLSEKWLLRRPNIGGEWFGVDLLDGWYFLGYVKPDTVEAGQRWRNQGHEYVVESFTDGVANLGGTSRASIEAMLKEDTFEYLGMAESAKPADVAETSAIVTLSDTQRRTLRHMLLEQRCQYRNSDEESSESLQAIASKAELQGTLDLSANECAMVLDTMPAFEVDHWIEVADLLKALKRGRNI